MVESDQDGPLIGPGTWVEEVSVKTPSLHTVVSFPRIVAHAEVRQNGIPGSLVVVLDESHQRQRGREHHLGPEPTHLCREALSAVGEGYEVHPVGATEAQVLGYTPAG